MQAVVVKGKGGAVSFSQKNQKGKEVNQHDCSEFLFFFFNFHEKVAKSIRFHVLLRRML